MIRLHPFATHSLLLAGLLALQALAGPAGGAPPEEFGLSTPEIVKADWESALLRVADLNGDGLPDFVAVNNTKGLLQIFEQEKQADARRFEKREEVLDDTVSDMLADDFNADGRADLVLASRGKTLKVRYQQKDGALAPAVPLDVQGGVLATGDLDRDGHRDLVVLEPAKVSVLHGLRKKPLGSVKALVFFNASTPASRPIVCDLDGNGLDDLVYLDSKRRSRLLVRFQNAPRQWGLESALEVTDVSDVVALRPAGRSDTKGKPALLVGIDAKTRELRLYRLEPKVQTEEKLPLAGPYFPSVDPGSQSGRESLVACDLTGNGRTDLVAASPRAAEMSLFIQDKRGALESRTAASLSDVQALAAVQTPKGALVFSLSGREETIGAGVWDAARGLSVPRFLDSDRKPLALAAADLDASGKRDLVYIFKDEKEALMVATIDDPADPGALRSKPRVRPLPGERDYEPVGMMAADVNGDKRCDLLIFSKYNPLRLLLQQKDGGFAPFATDQGMKKGIFDKVHPAQVAIADLDGDGSNEMLLARENFVRAYRIDTQGSLELVEQFNGKNVTARVASVAVANLDGEGRDEVILLDTANKVLTLYTRGPAGDYEVVRHHDVQGALGGRLLAVDANGDGRGDLAVFEGDRIQFFYSGQSSARLKTAWRRAPEDKEGKYAWVQTLELAGKGKQRADQLFALEGTDHVLEFFTLTDEPSATPKRFFHFKVFDDAKSISRGRDLRGRLEPRALLAADVDGDGLRDLVTLAHDNIIYYRQTRR